MQEGLTLPATELSVLLRTKQLSASELVEASIQRIEALNPILNAVVTDNFAAARKAAKKADKAIKDGDELGLLHGLPVGVKDLEVTKGLRTTFGSLLFAENIPDRDQSSVAALHREGGIIIGKTNTPEFGAGGQSPNRFFGGNWNLVDPGQNIWRLIRRDSCRAGHRHDGTGNRLGLWRVCAYSGRFLRGSRLSP